MWLVFSIVHFQPQQMTLFTMRERGEERVKTLHVRAYQINPVDGTLLFKKESITYLLF
jgi:6-phosphogluconolactonase (cycloisomerase 2 family)